MTSPRKPAIRPDWVTKTLAGVLLGLALGFGASAIYSDLHASVPLNIRGQLAMWIVVPIWLSVLGGVYFFTTGLRAWLWLGAANLLTYGVLITLRLL